MIKFDILELADALGIPRGKPISKRIILARIRRLAQKQEPRELINDYSTNTLDMCPVCGHEQSDEYGESEYCPNCGQRLLWGSLDKDYE